MATLVPCDDAWQPLEGAAPLPLREVAVDGITRYRMAAKDQVELQPGYRSDVLVRVDEPGNYCLLDDAVPAWVALFARPEAKRLLAKLRVVGEALDMPLPPSDLTAYAPLAPITAAEVTGQRRAEFDIVPSLGAGLEYRINGKTFDPDVVDHTMKLGTVEQWTLTSKLGPHPFHIHVNPFQVVAGAEPVWRDTILVRPRQTVLMRTRYARFDGKFVIHCHILDHEDRGMMQVLEVVP
jgi:FtsP/CotA-like multicopper oxidase with cupredoxin domain